MFASHRSPTPALHRNTGGPRPLICFQLTTIPFICCLWVKSPTMLLPDLKSCSKCRTSWSHIQRQWILSMLCRKVGQLSKTHLSVGPWFLAPATKLRARFPSQRERYFRFHKSQSCTWAKTVFIIFTKPWLATHLVKSQHATATHAQVRFMQSLAINKIGITVK